MSTKLQYNTEVVFGTSGVGVDKSVPNKIKITKLAQGLPVGGDIEYAAQMTIMRALQGRQEI